MSLRLSAVAPYQAADSPKPIAVKPFVAPLASVWYILAQMFSSCEHPPTARYWDLDEYRCRVCTASLTFPPRVPTPDDDKERKRDRGEKLRGPTPVQVVEVQVVEVQEVEVQEVEVSPSAPLLLCHCCKTLGIISNFSHGAELNGNHKPPVSNKGAYPCHP